MVQDVWHDPIDAVITWVDGLDPAHLQKRQIFMGSAPHLFHENATNPHRWACNGEIYLCLASLEHNAPWLRKIWIITDEQSPDLSRLSAPLRAKVHLVDHSEIFANHGAALPTFNSLAIETFLWNIAGLSDRFIYFNDDVFLTAPCEKSDFFSPSGPILRGAWADFGALQDDPIQMADPAKFNHYMQLNAADLCGVPAQRLFRAAHVAHPCLRRTMVHLHSRFEAMPAVRCAISDSFRRKACTIMPVFCKRLQRCIPLKITIISIVDKGLARQTGQSPRCCKPSKTPQPSRCSVSMTCHNSRRSIPIFADGWHRR